MSPTTLFGCQNSTFDMSFTDIILYIILSRTSRDIFKFMTGFISCSNCDVTLLGPIWDRFMTSTARADRDMFFSSETIRADVSVSLHLISDESDCVEILQLCSR